MYSLQEEVTKKYVLDYLSQEEIFEFYIGKKVVIGQKYISPLRRDKHPTCGFKYSRTGTLFMKDFSGHFWGNCFDFVMQLYNLSFGEALEKIASDFQLLCLGSSREQRSRVMDEVMYRQKTKTKIEIKIRALSPSDYQYWGNFGIGSRTLELFKVMACECVFVNGRKIFDYEYHREAVYAYRLERGEYKIYFPERQTERFLCNTTLIQGYSQLPDTGNLLVITKSMKDVMLLREFKIYSISCNSESTPIPEDIIQSLKQRFSMVVSLYDFDYTGICGANFMKKHYGIPYVFFTNGRFGTTNYYQKDLTDFYKMFGRLELHDLIHISYAHIKNFYYTQLHSASGIEPKTKGNILPKGC
ncbi:MAG TPA: hypothetical protein DCL77_02030 [Prolixibacteraceae bacterium]|jgi:hypothetical protein|nr:hypothetical protein [Prolixibacteraceae bacterium]